MSKTVDRNAGVVEPMSLSDIARGNRPLTSAELRDLIGTRHGPCPTCGGGFAGVNQFGRLVCLGCHPQLEDAFSLRVQLVPVAGEPGQFELADCETEVRRCEWIRERRAVAAGESPTTPQRPAIKGGRCVNGRWIFERIWRERPPARGLLAKGPGTVADWQDKNRAKAREVGLL